MPKIDVGALWEQSGHWLTDYTAAVIEECAKAHDELKEIALAKGFPDDIDVIEQCQSAVRRLKP